MTNIREMNGKGPKVLTGADLLARIKDAAREEQASRAPRPFGQYLGELMEALHINPRLRPIMSADQRIHEAITAKVKTHDTNNGRNGVTGDQIASGAKRKRNAKAERIAYFHEREDDRQIFGNVLTIEQFVTFIQSRAEGGPNIEKGALFIGPTGSAKTLLAEALMYGLEEALKEAIAKGQAQMFVIDGCPIQENALHLLPPRVRDDFQNAYGIEVTRDLCPHCKAVLDDKYNGDRMAMQVKPREFDVATGNGLAHIEAPMAELTPETELQLREQIRRADGGIAEFSELFSQNPAVLRALLDIIRSRQIQYQGKIYPLDMLIIANATLDNFQDFQSYSESEVIDVDAFLGRFELFLLPYILEYSEEARLYAKKLRVQEHEVNGKHVSDKTLELAAKLAVLSRLRDASKISSMDKLALYNGEEVEGFTVEDRRRYEREGREYEDTETLEVVEGMSGISSVDMVGFIAKEVTRADGCLNPLEMMTALRDFADAARRNLASWGRHKMTEQLQSLQRDVDTWVEQVVKQAFRDGAEGYYQEAFTNYIHHVQALVTDEQEVDDLTQQVKRPDMTFITEVESRITVLEVDPQDKDKKRARPLTADEIKELRTTLATSAGAKDRRGEQFIYTENPIIRSGIERYVSGESDKDINNTLRSRVEPKGIEAVAMAKMTERLAQVEHILVEKYGCCPHCAPQLVTYAGKRISDRMKAEEAAAEKEKTERMGRL